MLTCKRAYMHSSMPAGADAKNSLPCMQVIGQAVVVSCHTCTAARPASSIVSAAPAADHLVCAPACMRAPAWRLMRTASGLSSSLLCLPSSSACFWPVCLGLTTSFTVEVSAWASELGPGPAAASCAATAAAAASSTAPAALGRDEDCGTELPAGASCSSSESESRKLGSS